MFSRPVIPASDWSGLEARSSVAIGVESTHVTVAMSALLLNCSAAHSMLALRLWHAGQQREGRSVVRREQPCSLRATHEAVERRRHERSVQSQVL
jgi:hypothetical protein